MTTAYIWLGKNSEIDSSTGKINLDQLGSDKWTVRPLLDWTKDPSNSALDSFIPALVVHGDNPALKALLELLDAQLDNKPIGEPWKVFKFDRMAMTAVGGAINLADVPNSEHLFVPHKEIAFHLEAPQSALTLGPQVLTLKTATVDVQAHNSGDAAAIVLILNFKTLDLKPFNFDKSFDLTGKSLILAFDTGTGKLTVNGIPLNSDQDLPVTGAKHIPLGSQGELALTVDGETGSRDLGFEIEIANGSYTHKPLIPAIADSEVKITWPKIRVRLHKDRLGLAFPPGTPGDNILEASFKIPLIQAAVGPDAANLLARLIPTADSELKTVLSPLEFKVAIDRPTATLNIEPLLAVFKRVGHELEPVGSLAQEALATLKAKIINDDTPKSTVLSGMFAPLKELTADLNSKLKFTLDSIKGVIEGEFAFLEQFNTFNYKLPVALRISQDDKNELVCLVALQIDLWAGRLADNRAYYYLMQRKSGPVLTPGILDVSSFALQVPVRTVDEIQKLGLPTPEKHDGYLDFESLDVVFDMQAQFGDGRQMMVLFPGDLDKNKSENNKNRVRLLLEDFDPAIWPEKPQEKSGRTLRLRLGQRGLTLAAKAETVTPAEIPIPGAEESTDKTLAIRLVETRDGLRSALVVIDNQIRYADLAGRVAVPGFDGLEADIRLGLRRSAVEGPPVVVAAIDLDRTDRKPLARLKLPFLKAQLDDLRMQLTWTKKLGSNTPDWDLKAWASGAVSLTGDIKSTGGVQNLDQPRAIPFRDLELTELHKSKGKITLSGTAQHPTTKGNGNPAPSAADEVARFKLLDGQFLVEFQKALLEWDLQAKTMGFTAESARFTYQGNSGELFVDVHAGSIGLDLSVGSRSMKFKLSKSVGLEVRIGTQITFAGEVGWEDNAREHFFRADGRLRMTGFPEVAGSLKLGTGIKDDGAVVPNLAVFAELPFEADLFPGVVMKRLGVGLGLNNRLAAIGDRPDPRAILARIDEIDPKQSRNWSFVSQKGVYVSVVATTMLASNRGDVVCAYLAKLVLSLDTNLDVVAAAKIWLFSSAKFLEKGDNDRRPALIGAAVLQPRQKTFSLVAQTSPRPAIEGNKSISDLLNKVHARFSFYLSPELADYYLEELSYSDTLFGISVRANGSYRIAIGKFGALVRAQLALVGTLPEKNLTGGIGGFTFSGGLQLNADFGGLVSPSGLTAYGAVSLGITFRVSAYVMVPTIVFQTIEYEQTFSITISIPYLKCKKWRCKWQTREITETTTVRVSLTVPVLRIEPYHLPTTSL
ncbi:MAG: hypothetical protein NT069_23040, partial [Planctomycetota bacterium]|nr:hypothetical protein [Planctomycetota bacterium]